jgi:glycosyltransferase involved in cell wall biosynthesis
VEAERQVNPVSVVIPTWNRKEFIADVLKPVLDDPATGEVVVVIDGSSDGTFELLTEWSQEDPRIRPILQENLGDAAARQRGVEEAVLDVVVVIDDDVISSPGMISGHARHHEEGSRRLVLGYMPTPLPKPRQPGQVATVLYTRDYEAKCDSFEADPSLILKHFWMGNLSMPRSCALEVGFASRAGVRRHSDMEFGFRCQEAGIEAVFDRTLEARHSYSRTLEQFAAQGRRSGDARAKLMRTYPNMAQNLSPFNVTSKSKRLLVRALSSPRVYPVAAPVVMSLTSVSGRLKLWSVETRCAETLGRLEGCRGFRLAGGSV